jgi:DNA helicase HerA-like ATPase
MAQHEFDISENGSSAQISYNGKQSIAEQKARLEAEEQTIDGNENEQQYNDAIAFVHFDAPSTKSNMVEALVHYDDLGQIERGKYVRIFCKRDGKEYTGRILEGPFFDPDALKRDSTPVQFIIMNQGGKKPFIPEYHGRIVVEILGEERGGILLGAVRRPHPGSPIIPFQQAMMEKLLHLEGKICLGYLDNYEDTLVRIRENDKGVIPRNWLTVGTIGSGKSNTNQVFIEETLAAGFAQIVLDPEGEYIFMDQPTDSKSASDDLPQFARIPQGVKNLTVYRPPLATSKRQNAVEFSVPFDSLSPEMIMELTEMSPAQQTRFILLYDQAVRCLRKTGKSSDRLTETNVDISRGYPGIKLAWLVEILKQELAYYNWKRGKPVKRVATQKKKELTEVSLQESDESQEMTIYCHKYEIEPLIKDQYDESSYSALHRKLRYLSRTDIFDKKSVSPLNIQRLCQPGHLSVIDMSDCGNQQVVNIIIADLLSRVYLYKIKMSEEMNEKHKVIITIEEAHGFVSRERQDKMLQTLDQLRRIARRGRKRWLCLHLVTQSPQHLPAELFELVNNKIIHQMTGAENLRVLKAAAGMVNEAIWDDVPSMGRGRAVIVCQGQYPHPIIARIRPASSYRGL